jgi:ATP-dependent exoDNAse (exonuclease V) beta subunit
MTDFTTLYSFSKNTVLRAGAGTGKTETLATLYLHLVGGLCDPEVWPKSGVVGDRVVALTFTEKAAVEMRERIADAVRALAYEAPPAGIDSPNPLVRQQAAEHWSRARGLDRAATSRLMSLAASAAVRGRPMPERAVWQRIAFSLGQAKIGTFHGFAAGVLRSIAMDIGLDPAFVVTEQEESDAMLRTAITDALAHTAASDVDAIADLLAAEGGFGTDDDRGLVARLIEIVHSLDEAGLQDSEIGHGPVGDATPPHAFIVADRVERFALATESVAALRDEDYKEKLMALARSIRSVGVVDTPDRARKCVALIGATKLPAKNRTRDIEAEAQAAREALASMQEAALVSHSAWLAGHARTVVLDARRRFRAEKQRRRVLDFADLLRRLRDGLRDDPRLRRLWRARFDAVLVDEFQDTNRLQRDVLYLLRERADRTDESMVTDASQLEPSGLLLVGDAKQSIYAFRGADVGVFLETERALLNAGGLSLELNESYRSVESVLAAINPATEALLGTGLTASGEHMFDRTRDMLKAQAKGDSLARVELLLVSGETADECRELEAQAIARRIRAMVSGVNGGIGLNGAGYVSAVNGSLGASGATTHPESLALSGEGAPAEGWRPPRLDEIAILVPTWGHTECIKQALQREGIVYAQLGGPGFWERREVVDLLVLLQLVADPSDRLALASVLRGPLVALSDAALAHLLKRDCTLDQTLDPDVDTRARLADDDRARLDDARPILKRLISLGASFAPDEVLRAVVSDRNFAGVLAALPFAAQRVANVDKLVAIAADAVSKGGEPATVAGFVRWVEQLRTAAGHEAEADVSDVSAGAVQLLSIHGAKGLEWPVVFVAQTSRRRRTHAERVLLDSRQRIVALPGGYTAPLSFQELRKDAHSAEDDDQRRLLYVALTRARDFVVVSGPAHDGDGDWRTLSHALLQQAQNSVRVLRPGMDGPPITVRSQWNSTHASATTDIHNDAPAEPAKIARPKRLVVNAGALNEFSRCPRRYLHRYELALPEELAGDMSLTKLSTLVRQAIVQALPCVAGQEAENAERWVSALDDADDPRVREQAVRVVRAALAMEHGRALSRVGAIAGKQMFTSVKVLSPAIATRERAITAAQFAADSPPDHTSQGRELLLDSTVDLLVDAQVLGGAEHALVALRIALAAEGPVDPLWWREELLAMRLAVQARVGQAQRVEAGVWIVAVESSKIVWLAGGDATQDRAHLFELGAEFGAAQAEQQWDGRPRALCERTRCGYVSRCHG